MQGFLDQLNRLAATLGVGNAEQLLVLMLIFGATLLIALAVIGVVAARNPMRRRLGTAGGVDLAAGTAGGRSSIRYSTGEQPLSRFLHDIGARLAGKDADVSGKTSAIRRRLVQAGYFAPTAVATYYALRLVLAVALPLGFIVVAPLISSRLGANQLLLIALLMGLVGAYLPMIWLVLRTRSRQTLAREGFPDALDMMLVCVEAGMGLDAAIDRVGLEVQRAHPTLAVQFALMSAELRAGRRREDALRNFADRIGIEEVSTLVTLLLQSEKLGTSLAQTLRVHADEMRAKRMLRAEEKAGRLPVLLSVPLVLFILPALMTVILTPAIIRVVRDLLPALANK
jgi:tight adherence protein C